ncbi:Pre-rRNA-processing protein ipi3 [Yamadazyma tenuis]|uniref:Pre-rRNA-processing protein IPI3 n=1 Tax=Candida tenuis (strain ATCC 10573 / BCRC 21748 / CBS 615 / JCM 9827 / NBRC 10315 / NRRL Y-1498 / VKM Y-70) TaxID=590646 RepID=G3B3V9_CANTC|nr:Pre-rRNA-processing protein IPI3 [Yamadazyma tenuis ATCC 10573]XP_006686546.1 uncharacterized protein CANTEDRAFT_113784 [Yamadazyma tenuis ATCC 10573]EGV64231.1 Pre-rRNA-processing protein IPI3 [Yamadazyma tenuis ATCC 10573]EGV64232.1 hypothetical protein CANTEDRAFT_113784 [Yamadazyma tenuis ATCC 10573]WEJ96645.1 Pre-rRNA-processing protein ipi3 [Yamadazyma tenuis]
MEEVIFYVGQGDPTDKQSQESYAFAQSVHGSRQLQMFRNADCAKNGAAFTGVGIGEKAFIASPNKALINVYSFGKDGIDQRMPVPEQVNCLAVLKMNTSPSDQSLNKPSYRTPWLLAAGSKTGKVYIWDILSGELIFAKDVHYQSITKIAFSKCGTFLITGSEDSRCLIFKTIELVSIFNKDHDTNVKPYMSITDHTLPVTDFYVSNGLINDVSLYTVSIDSTLRVYNITTRQLMHTFVLSSSIECVTVDPCGRNMYLGLTNGQIRVVPMFKVNNMNLERAGKFGEILTVPNDPELQNTLTAHDSAVSQLEVSLDGMSLISGDVNGNVYVSDITSKQIVRSFKISTAITHISAIVCPEEAIKNDLVADKRSRLLPPLKRVLQGLDQVSYEVNVEIPEAQTHSDISFQHWLDAQASDELSFKIGTTSSTGTTTTTSSEDGQKLAKLSTAYAELKAKYDELLADHRALL